MSLMDPVRSWLMSDLEVNCTRCVRLTSPLLVMMDERPAPERFRSDGQARHGIQFSGWLTESAWTEATLEPVLCVQLFASPAIFSQYLFLGVASEDSTRLTILLVGRLSFSRPSLRRGQFHIRRVSLRAFAISLALSRLCSKLWLQLGM